MSKKDFTGRRVWITGASSGIGRAVAIEFARRGAVVIGSARNVEALDQLAREIGAEQFHACPLDVAVRQDASNVARAIRDRCGGVDIAVLNAGMAERIDLRLLDSAVFERVIQTNFLGMVYCIEAVLPLLRESPAPHLVGMSSVISYGGLPRAEAYGSSKAAVRYLLESLRIDLSQENIPVTVVCPGFVRTPMTDRNDFPMPFLMEADAAARIIVDGIAVRKHEIHFPKRLTVTFKVLARLPSRLYTRLGERLRRLRGE